MAFLTKPQIEIAARELCKLRGVDPDKIIGHGAKPDENGFVPDVMLFSPQWELAVEEIEQHLLIFQAVDHAIANTQPIQGEFDAT